MVAGVVLSLAAGSAAAQPGQSAFEHDTTGFPLTGLHEFARCEACHIRGIFKSTPRDCGICHVQNNVRSAVSKPVNHLPTTMSCDSCHTTLTFSGARYDHAMAMPGSCAACHNNVVTTGKTATHPVTTASCDNCHTTVSFSAIAVPVNHIPYAPGAQCAACHTNADYSVMPALASIHANAPSTTSNCAQCHGAAAAGFAIPANNFFIVGQPTNHLPTGAPCESCHVGAGSSVAALPVANGAKFSGSRMNHAGITNNCETCHMPAGTAPNFAGITSIVGQPPTSPMGPGSHIPSGTSCESCHLGSLANVGGLISANATRTAPGTLFATPAPTGAQIHAGVTGGCSACHEAGYVWMGVSAYPINPSVLTNNTTPYTGFQTRPRAAAGAFNVVDPAHPSTGDCSQCHSGTTFFDGQVRPPNHIPFATSAQCTACHTSTDYKVMPTLANIHANAPSTTTNCEQCHGAAAPSFAIPATGFSIVGMPANHIPTGAPCDSCHVGAGSSVTALPVPNGAKFANSRMNHAGITNNCVACHVPAGAPPGFAGITAIVGQPPTSPMGPGSHIPSGTACESCHLGSLGNVAGLIPASATRTVPGTLFATPAPSGAQIHAGVTSGCSACHESGYMWLGVSAYPIAPTIKTMNAQYTGFQTRPRAAAGTFNITDATHPATGDCSQCHSSTMFFSSGDKPANHIPYAAAAQCAACHTSTDYAVMPTLANIHANAESTTSNCAQCHGAAAASFAIPGANFSIVGQPTNHIPSGEPCETCHVGTGSSVPALPVPNGAKFSGSRMNHTGITRNCVACHVPAGAAANFAGITTIVGMPPTSPMGASSHIPSNNTCETCHLGTLANVGGLIPANATRTAPGTLFATPAPTSPQIHTGITSGCSTCHEGGNVWMGMTAYPISPTVMTTGAQYTGFHTRPRAAASTYSVADPTPHPATGDCSQCHSGTNFFSAQDKPANHIPYLATAACTACHTNPDYAVMPTLANIHANAQSTTNNCAQCHGAAAASFAIPGANFTIVGLPSNHIPTSAACELCHVGTGSSVPTLPVPNGAKFTGSRMSHTGITNNCVACHQPSGSTTTFAGITRIIGLPPTSPMGASSHIPSSTTCETCHLGTLANVTGLIPASATRTVPGSLFATPAPTTVQIHTGITSGCNACHEGGNVWMGISAYPIAPTVKTNGAQYTGFHTRPRAAASTYSVADANHPLTGDCSQCHSGTNFFSAQDKPANHIPYAATAQCTSCHTTPGDYATMPTLANIHLYAPSTTANCAQCHGTTAASFAIPANNFFIVGLPSNHIPTSAACELCHVGTGSSVPVLPVPNAAKFSNSRMSHTGITNNCVACHLPSGSTTTFAGITNIIGLPRTTPVGASSHIPSSTTCETCHVGTLANVPGLIPANATRSVPGSLFATPAPTTAQIHTGITSGCNACHEGGYVWMGMTSYPINPTTVVANAQYTGFHTRPRAAASTYSVADAAHPTTGDCGDCHSGTAYFTGQAKPAGHIPTQLPNCTTCHVVAGNFSVTGLTTNMATMHTGITSGCITCHTAGPGAGPFAGCATPTNCASPPPLTYQPKMMPLAAGASPMAPSKQTHVPAPGIACEKCHSPTVFTSFAGMNMKNNTPAHTAVGTYTCITCHEGGYTWFGVTIVTRNVGHEGRKAGEDCIPCHNRSYNQFNRAIRPVIRAARIGAGGQLLPRGGLIPDASAGPVVGFDHQGVLPGQCLSCHNGVAARGLPKKHLATKTSCDTCHRTTTWLPAKFSHQGMAAGQCASCHNAVKASGKSSSHFLTARSCDACHRTLAWVPVSYSHLSPAYRPAADKPLCVNCHITNGEIIPRVMHSNPRLRPVPAPTGP
jgi:hypothetical protein